MPYSSPEVLQLEAIRDWMATLPLWSVWAGAGRVVWPLKAAPALPVCVLSFSGGRTINRTGAAGGANFSPSGSITAQIYAADTAPSDPQQGYSDFADKFFGLISEMADSAHVAPVLFNEFLTPDVPIIHSSWVNTEDGDEGLSAWWQGQITIRWGVDE